MRDDDGLFGQFNQSLYFARLQADSAESLFGQQNTFQAAQLQCFCEASVNCLYRALCFLTCCFLDNDKKNALMADPDSLLQVVSSSIAKQPSPALQEIVQLIAQGQSEKDGLARLLVAYARWWQITPPKRRENTVELLSSREIDISIEQCRHWHQQLSELGLRLRAYGLEY